MKLKQCLSSIAITCLPFAVASASPWPTSAPDNVTTPVNQSIRIDVLANDTGEGLKLRKVNDWSVNGGRARINDDGVSVTYQPRNGYQGTDVLLNDEGIGLSLVSINEWTANGNVVRMSNDRKSVTFRSLKPFSSWPFVDEFWYSFQDFWGRTNSAKVNVTVTSDK